MWHSKVFQIVVICVGKHGRKTIFQAILRVILSRTLPSIVKGYHIFVFSSVNTLKSYICLLKMVMGWMRNCHPNWPTWDGKMEWKNGKRVSPHMGTLLKYWWVYKRSPLISLVRNQEKWGSLTHQQGLQITDRQTIWLVCAGTCKHKCWSEKPIHVVLRFAALGPKHFWIKWVQSFAPHEDFKFVIFPFHTQITNLSSTPAVFCS